MKKTKLTSIILIAGTIIVVGVSLVLAMVLRSPSSEKPIVPTKIKASQKTYTKIIAFNRITPTSVITTTESQANSFSSEEDQAQVQNITPTINLTPTDVNIVITPVLTNTSTPSAQIIATASSTLTPTRIQSLPESGLFGLSGGLLVLAVTFLVAAFLL